MKENLIEDNRRADHLFLYYLHEKSTIWSHLLPLSYLVALESVSIEQHRLALMKIKLAPSIHLMRMIYKISNLPRIIEN